MSNKILIVNGNSYGRALEGLGKLSNSIEDFKKNTKDYKLILFTGGADISPELYNDTSPLGYCSYNKNADTIDIDVYTIARKYNIKMTGICRGSQFINVMNGGRMMHHITNHGTSDGHMFMSEALMKPIKVNTLHHQMSIIGPKGFVIGWCPEKRSNKYIGRNDIEEKWDKPEVEAILYPESLCCGVQYHPEMMEKDSDGYSFYYKMIANFLSCSINEFTKMYTNVNILKSKEA